MKEERNTVKFETWLASRNMQMLMPGFYPMSQTSDKKLDSLSDLPSKRGALLIISETVNFNKKSNSFTKKHVHTQSSVQL